MKGLVITAIVLGGLVLAGYVGLGKLMAADTDVMLAMAAGNPSADQLQLQIVIAPLTVKRDPPEIKRAGDIVVENWDKWIDDHFTLTDESGERMRLDRKHFGNLIPERKVGTPDSYLHSYLTIGKTYTLEFVPVISEGKRYRCTLNARASGIPFERRLMSPVES